MRSSGLKNTIRRKIVGGIRFAKEVYPAIRGITSQKMRWQALQDNGLVTVGAHTYGLPNVLYWNYGTKLTIGKYCSIAQDAVFLLGGEHRADWVSSYPFGAFLKEWPAATTFKEHTRTKGDISVGNDVWIGHGAIILSGVTIGTGAIVGAGSVVTKNVEEFSIVAGNPAKFIRYRFDEKNRDRLRKLAWWNWPEEKISRNLDKLMAPPDDTTFSNQ